MLQYGQESGAAAGKKGERPHENPAFDRRYRRGHLRASAAVEQYIRDNTEYEVVTVDALKAVGRFLDKTVCDSYRSWPSARR